VPLLDVATADAPLAAVEPAVGRSAGIGNITRGASAGGGRASVVCSAGGAGVVSSGC
jgi:hypothetical protein